MAADVPASVQMLCAALRQRHTGITCVGAPAEVLVQCSGSTRRGVYCQRVALAEMLVLASAQAFIYSKFSSFSEVALMLSRPSQCCQMGCAGDEAGTSGGAGDRTCLPRG